METQRQVLQSLPWRLEKASQEQKLEITFAHRRALQAGTTAWAKPGGVEPYKVFIMIGRKNKKKGLKDMRLEKWAGCVFRAKDFEPVLMAVGSHRRL